MSDDHDSSQSPETSDAHGRIFDPGLPANYAIGYRRPPTASRFKPGQTGNPRGRTKESRSIKVILRTLMHEKITIRTPRGTKRITKTEALIHTLFNQAIKGDSKAREQLLRLVREYGLDSDIRSVLDVSVQQALTDEDNALLDRLLKLPPDDVA